MPGFFSNKQKKNDDKEISLGSVTDLQASEDLDSDFPYEPLPDFKGSSTSDTPNYENPEIREVIKERFREMNKAYQELQREKTIDKDGNINIEKLSSMEGSEGIIEKLKQDIRAYRQAEANFHKALDFELRKEPSASTPTPRPGGCTIS